MDYVWDQRKLIHLGILKLLVPDVDPARSRRAAMSTDKLDIVYKWHMPASACQLFPDVFALIPHPEKSWAKAPFRQVNGSVSPLQPLVNMRKKTERDASAQPAPQPFQPFARVNF
jgi:hypothetical protein